jgi:hypothetical protein
METAVASETIKYSSGAARMIETVTKIFIDAL